MIIQYSSKIEDLVSVIIPTVNRKNLYRCLDSINNQSYKNIEIIIVDDSSDEDPKFFYKNLDKNIKLKINNSRLGTAASRNIGYSLISEHSKYVIFHDDDDISFNNKLEYLVDYLDRNHNVDFVGSFFDFIDDNEKFINFEDVSTCSHFKRSVSYKSILYRSHIVNHFVPSCVLLRRIVCDIMIPFKNIFDEDYEFFNRLLMNGYVGVNIPYILTNRTYGKFTKTSNRNEQSDIETYNIRNRYSSFLHKIYENRGFKKICIVSFYDDKNIDNLNVFLKSVFNNFMCRYEINVIIFSNKKILIANKNVFNIVENFDYNDHYELYNMLLKYKNIFSTYDNIYKINYNAQFVEHVEDEMLSDFVFVVDSSTNNTSCLLYGGSYNNIFKMFETITNNYCLYDGSEDEDISKYLKYNNYCDMLDKSYSVYKNKNFENKEKYMINVRFNI